jgi:hypothetical protein
LLQPAAQASGIKKGFFDWSYDEYPALSSASQGLAQSFTRVGPPLDPQVFFIIMEELYAKPS